MDGYQGITIKVVGAFSPPFALQEQLLQVPGGSSALACDVQLSVLPARAGEPLLANQRPFEIT